MTEAVLCRQFPGGQSRLPYIGDLVIGEVPSGQERLQRGPHTDTSSRSSQTTTPRNNLVIRSVYASGPDGKSVRAWVWPGWAPGKPALHG